MGNNSSKFLTDAIQMHGKDFDCQTLALCKWSSIENWGCISQKGIHIAFPLAMDSTSLITTNLYTKRS